jgi:hypothetical protein
LSEFDLLLHIAGSLAALVDLFYLALALFALALGYKMARG